MTVAALECAALQRCSFLLSIKMRTPCTGHSVRGDFFLLFLLACLCELHRIRIVQAEMGLAGSRTSFSFPPNRKPSKCDFLHMPSCLPACTSYPAGHRLWLAVFIPWLRVRGHGFSFGYFASFAALWDDTPHMTCGGLRGTAPRVIAFRTKTALKSEKHTMGMWTRSYFVSTAGDVSNATIQRYVEEQKTRGG